jgi:hypothetical protein
MKVRTNVINLDVAPKTPDRQIDSFEYETPDSIETHRERVKMLKAALYVQDRLLENAALQKEQQIDVLTTAANAGQIDKEEAEPHVAALHLELARIRSHDHLPISQDSSESPPPMRRLLCSFMKDMTSGDVIYWQFYDIQAAENLTNESIAKAMKDSDDQMFESKFAKTQRLDRAEELWAQGERNIVTICETINPKFIFLSVAERETFARKVSRALAKRRRSQRQGAKKSKVAETKHQSLLAHGDKGPVVIRNVKKGLAPKPSKSRVVKEKTVGATKKRGRQPKKP